MKDKLNLGCGTDIKEGWVNLDSSKIEGVNVVHNINNIPLPFKDGQFTEIVANDILEHVDYIPLMKELHRILNEGGILHIRVPHFTSVNNFIDPTHIRQFSIDTFDFFTKDSPRDYYFDFSFQRTFNKKIDFRKGENIYLYNYPIQWLVNLRYKIMVIYENTFLSRLFPAQNISIDLIK